MPRLTESRAQRAKLPEHGQRFEWCSEVRGFGVRLTAGGARTYVVQLTYGQKEPRITLGRVGTLAFEGPSHAPGARDLAIAALNASRHGDDPRAAINRRRDPEGVRLDTVLECL